MPLVAVSTPRFLRKSNLSAHEYHRNFVKIDCDILAAIASPEADAVTPLMSKIYLRLVSAPTQYWERRAARVLYFGGERRDGREATAWNVLCRQLGVASATARKALAWLHAQGIITYYAGKNGVGIRIFLNHAASAIGVAAARPAAKKFFAPPPASSAAGHTSTNEAAFKDLELEKSLDLNYNSRARAVSDADGDARVRARNSQPGEKLEGAAVSAPACGAPAAERRAGGATDRLAQVGAATTPPAADAAATSAAARESGEAVVADFVSAFPTHAGPTAQVPVAAGSSGAPLSALNAAAPGAPLSALDAAGRDAPGAQESAPPVAPPAAPEFDAVWYQLAQVARDVAVSVAARCAAQLKQELHEAARRAGEQSTAREMARTREWFEARAMPKAVRVAQKETFKLFERLTARLVGQQRASAARRVGAADAGEEVAGAPPEIESGATGEPPRNSFAAGQGETQPPHLTTVAPELPVVREISFGSQVAIEGAPAAPQDGEGRRGGGREMGRTGEAAALWAQIRARLARAIGSAPLETWFSPATLAPIGFDHQTLTLRALHPFVPEWIAANYRAQLDSAIAEAAGGAPLKLKVIWRAADEASA